MSMDIIATGPSPLTMSSREIAELCDKRHDHVMRDIKKMLDDLGEDAPSFGGVYSGGNGEDRPCFNPPKDLTLTLVAGYNVILRKRIIDRWMELEGQTRLPDLSDPAVLIQLLTEHASKRIEAEQRAAKAEEAADRMRDDVAALDRISRADGSLSITEAAKALQMRPKDLFQFLQRHGWIYKRSGSSTWLGYSDKASAALPEHKVTTVLRNDGSEKVTEQVRVTPKGMAKLAKTIHPARLI